MSSDAAFDLDLMRAMALLDTDPAAAAARAAKLVAVAPGHEEALLLLATATQRIGQLDSALAVLGPLAAAHPGSPVLQLEWSRALQAAGRAGEAAGVLERLVAATDGLAEAWRELAPLRFAAGDVVGGDRAYARFLALTPDDPELTDARVALAANMVDTADALLKAHLAAHPANPFTLHLLADSATRRGNPVAVERFLQQALAAAPGYAPARYDLARLLNTQQRINESMPLIARLREADPANAGFRYLEVEALRMGGRTEQAIAGMRAFLTEHPDDPKALVVTGSLLREVGAPADAIACYRKALAIRPGYADAYWCLADMKTVQFSAEDIESMERELAARPVLGSNRPNLEFALGRALEEAGEYQRSFEHYRRGNELQRAVINYDAMALGVEVMRAKALLTERFFRARAGWGDARPDPVFIVGLPRSGSTLVEQILGSHPDVEATRELSEVSLLAQRLLDAKDPEGKAGYPLVLDMADEATIAGLAAAYLDGTRAQRHTARPRFVDKMLGNFGHIGFIHLMFPNAAIIDVRRHPMACGFSCFKQLFAGPVTFSYDMAELGFYYRDYADLMSHFDAVLPGRVHRVYYEKLVTDPEGEVRRLLEYCRLPFDPACLRFYENPRAVTTHSSEQVRQPIYTASLAEWRNYEPWLGPLREALGDLVDRYPII